MRRIFCFTLLALALVIHFGFAAAAPPAKEKPTVKPPAAKTAAAAITPAAAAGDEKLTQVRWANHTDAVTGVSKLRLVFDTTGPVEVSSETTGSPTPRLVVTVKGATPEDLPESIAFDGKIADSVSISADGNNTVITVETPVMVEEGEYKAFTLRADPANKRPFRVVVDIDKPTPLIFKFTAGLKGKVIAIDPGHGGSDPGAIGPAGNTEKDVNLQVSLKVKVLLEKAGAKVVMTRTGDNDVFGPNASAVEELKARATVANLKKTDVFISIHSNSFSNRTVGGTATYYYQKTRYDALLARSIQAADAQQTGLQNRGAFASNFYVVKRTLMPAALVEMAFLSNPDEEKLLTDPQFQQKIAQGIVTGVENFFAQAAKMGGGR